MFYSSAVVIASKPNYVIIVSLEFIIEVRGCPDRVQLRAEFVSTPPEAYFRLAPAVD